MNELASPARSWDVPREATERVLFVVKEIDGPHQNDWTSEPY